MKRLKKIIAIILSVIMVFSVSVLENVATEQIEAATAFVITTPTNGELKAAGHIDIQWTDASSQGAIKNYELYVDGSLVATTGNLSYEFYTTKVNYHTAFVVAEFTDGVKISTPSVRFSVTKKGLCVNDTMGKKLDPVAMNMGWYYTWGTTPFSYTTYSKIEFVPMIWGTGNESSITTVKSKNYKYVLAYNEPDMPLKDKYGNWVGGSNVNVNTAISHWNKFSGIGQYVGAPAPAQSPSWAGGTWFRTFMDGINQSTVDFIPLHCYYSGWAGIDAANAFLTEVVDAVYEMYHKPIWITEYAPSNLGYNSSSNRASVNQFLKKTIEGLNSRDYVVRYSWFSFDPSESSGAAALWTNSTGKLTDLGNTYVSYGNPTTDCVTGNAVNNYPNVKPEPTTEPPTKATTVKKPAKAKIKSAKNVKGKKIKISLKKISKVAGYQIRYSDSKKFNGYWTKTTKKTSYTIKKLKKKTRYYIKARAYVKNGSKKLYGSWSKVKNVKVKK